MYCHLSIIRSYYHLILCCWIGSILFYKHNSYIHMTSLTCQLKRSLTILFIQTYIRLQYPYNKTLVQTYSYNNITIVNVLSSIHYQILLLPHPLLLDWLHTSLLAWQLYPYDLVHMPTEEEYYLSVYTNIHSITISIQQYTFTDIFIQ